MMLVRYCLLRLLLMMLMMMLVVMVMMMIIDLVHLELKMGGVG